MGIIFRFRFVFAIVSVFSLTSGAARMDEREKSCSTAEKVVRRIRRDFSTFRFKLGFERIYLERDPDSKADRLPQPH